jgi:hypothetical protein
MNLQKMGKETVAAMLIAHFPTYPSTTVANQTSSQVESLEQMMADKQHGSYFLTAHQWAQSLQEVHLKAF